MLDQLLTAAIQSGGFTVAAFLAAIAALWKSLRSAHTERVSALESAVAGCMKKHESCERHNRQISLAVIDMIENRDEQAVAKLRNLLRRQDEDQP